MRPSRIALYSWFLVALFYSLGSPPRASAFDDAAEIDRNFELWGEALNEERYEDSERYALKMIDLSRKSFPEDIRLLGSCMSDLANTYYWQSRYPEAEKTLREAIALLKKSQDTKPEDWAYAFYTLGMVFTEMAKYDDAMQLYEAALKYKEQLFGAESVEAAEVLNSQAWNLHKQAKYEEAKALYERSMQIVEKVAGPQDQAMALPLHNLAWLYQNLGRYPEAESLLDRSAEIYRDTVGSDNIELAAVLNTKSAVLMDLGRYGDSVRDAKQAVAMYEKVLGSEAIELASPMTNLALAYGSQSRYSEADALLKRVAELERATYGSRHPELAKTMLNLAWVNSAQERYDMAAELLREAMSLYVEFHGRRFPDVALVLSNLAQLSVIGERYEEAEEQLKEAIDIVTFNHGPLHPYVGLMTNQLAEVRFSQLRYDEAEVLADRALAIAERAGSSSGELYQIYLLRAQISWKLERPYEALGDLRRAMNLAEEQRGQAAGAEHERAANFAEFAAVFELMVEWQEKIGDMSETLAAMERGRARSLLDEMRMAGAELGVARSNKQEEDLRQRETQIKNQIAQLEKSLGALPKRPKQPAEIQQRQQLEKQLATARRQLYEHYRDERSNNPLYQTLLSGRTSTTRLSQLRRRVVENNGLMLLYMFGEEGGFVLAINGKDTSLHALEVSEQDAKTLGIEPGPLTAGSIREVLIREDRRGVVQLLALPQGDDQLQPKLAALWRALIPEPHRSQLAASEFNRLVVVPDGALALMPFEALVVSDGEEPTYLLDVGPPTIYGPSATVLYQLAEARTDRVETSIEPVLTLGNPTYPATTDESSPLRQLAPLVFSGTESDWVSQVFQKQGIKSQQLVAGQATEAQLTQQVKGRKVIHLACHGFAEQSLGNFFGALALTPGGKNGDSEPHDDGFLTLAEIYEMNLNDCELAILSACETNTGEQQRGEGVWSLSRGFLVAGARRVVASNWLVDDRAAASLVSYFCSSIASQEASGEKVDYAEALHKAKRWSRRQEKWKSPFFWSTFVLVGPS